MSASHGSDTHSFKRIGGATDRRLLVRLLVFARPHVTVLSFTVLLLVANLGLRLTGPLIIRKAVDGPLTTAAETRGAEAFDADLLTNDVTRLALWYLAVAAALSLLLVLREWIMNRTGQRIVLTIRNTLFHHVLRLPSAWFDKHHVGWTVTRTTNDVDALSELFTTGVATIAYDILTIIAVIIALLLLSPKLAVVALLILPLMMFVSFRFRLKARLAYRATRNSLGRLNSFLQERLTGLDVVHLFRREDASAATFAGLNTQYYADNMVTVRHFSRFFPTVDVLSWSVKLGTLCFGSWLLLEGELSIGTWINFWLLLDFVFEPIRELAERYNVLQAAMAAGERIFGILDSDTESGPCTVAESVAAANAEEAAADANAGWPKHSTQGEDVPAISPVISSVASSVAQPTSPSRAGFGSDPRTPMIAFDDVSFSYTKGPAVLSNVSFTVQRGQRLAIVGHTGSGKSTLVSLLCRFRETDRGRIRVAGRPIDLVDHRELRRRIAIVQQEVFLFSDTIAANIRMGDPTMDDARMKILARAVNADRFIDKLPLGYETMLQERGTNLSSGQRQLVSFARALAADPEILVLDEATSSVDSETEHWIESATATLLEGRTSVVIAHRLSTVINADLILVMHKGQIRESGTHDELLAKEGLYHRLYRLHLSGHA
ncbi:MAG: ATP-binding cassette subfamily B multidrug efflux pump [Pseudohongiellaceae bacterium]